MKHHEHTEFEKEFASIMIFAGILVSGDQEEDLIQRLQNILDSGIVPPFDTLRRVEQKLADEELYELANVVKTFIEYNAPVETNEV